MKKTLLIITLVLEWCICFSQTRQGLDDLKELKQKLSIATHDTSRVVIMVALCNFYSGFNQDSSAMFGNKALALARRINFPEGEADALLSLGFTFRILGDLPKSLELQYQGLQIAENNKLPLLMAECLRGIGVVYMELKDYNKAISYFKRGKLINETIQHTREATTSELLLDMNIGICYMRKNQLDSSFALLSKFIRQEDAI
ncbi:MAG: tetratricopeptide repeat protein [Nocardioidaceae bacterium]